MGGQRRPVGIMGRGKQIHYSFSVNSFTSMFSLSFLLTACHIFRIIVVLRIGCSLKLHAYHKIHLLPSLLVFLLDKVFIL